MNFYIGEVVIYTHSNEEPYYYYGMVINIDNDIVNLLRIEPWSGITNDKTNISMVKKFKDLDCCVEHIESYYDEKIKNSESQLKSVRRSDYQLEMRDKYVSIKNDIINTAVNMIECTNDVEFEEKLKAICTKKKNLFAMECDEVAMARKFNGAILYDIKDFKKKKSREVTRLKDFEYVNKKLGKEFLHV